MALREPDFEFVVWLKHFDPNLRVRWNPQRQRWVIDERNRVYGHWQCLLVWEDDDGNCLDLNRDLCLRLQLMSHKYKKMIVSPDEYFDELDRKAEFMQREAIEHISMDNRGVMREEWKWIKPELVKFVQAHTVK